ncbi:unnamed protein product [Angiostrongylus costaricensis]|uniref:chitin synthase n=1 Tax=Angiostrongylus costaricensis TaxID=334426 RepID=A0A0R3PLS3_ANGCS|nr:unnamed protein product [Angiostrongylus costaricensis]
MSSGEDDYRWNAFRSHKRATAERPSLTPWMITSLQVTKASFRYLKNHDPFTSTIIFGKVFKIYGSINWLPSSPIFSFDPRMSDNRLTSIVVLETLRALGLSLLVFTVFPQLDLYRCLYLCACFPVITALQRLLSDVSRTFRPGRSFGARMLLSVFTLPHLVLFLVFLSSLICVLQGAWVLPLSLLTISTGFWESWVSTQHSGTTLQGLYQVSMFPTITTHTFMHWRLLTASLGLLLLNVSLRGCARFLSAIGMRAFSLLHPVTVVPVVGYVIVSFICNQKICEISEFLSRVGLRWSCDRWGTTLPFNDWYICMVWLLIGAYRGYNFAKQNSYDNCDEIVESMPSVYNGFSIEQSLVVFYNSLNKSVYWFRESFPDYLWFFRSSLRSHIFFDDSWEDQTERGVTKRVPNDFFRTFFETLSGLIGMSRILLNTPYGGRLVVKLPAGTLLFVHLKDKKLIRHKKRWSQVMYMYYLLGHRIMDSPLSIEDRQQMADNTFVLAIDGDSKFQPEAVMRLMNRMKTKSNIGCACGRIHPIGSGLMVWYQKFEYAIGHWFQKAAEHVFGCVLCAPGCFSLFRASALMDDNIMHKLSRTTADDFSGIQKLPKSLGYRIEYVAASDAETYAPEGFEEFFNQRRRWTPSSIANTIDLLADYKRASANNHSISMSYIAYQFMVVFFSMLAPAIIFAMLVFAQVSAFGVDSTKVMIYNGIPVSLFIVVCFTTESNVQLLHAKLMSVAYAFVMLAVLIATLSQIVLETVVSPASMFIVSMVLIFFVAACLHPKEFTNIIYGIVFFLMIPSTYVFLTFYSLINLNVINWGTREAVAKATGKVLFILPFLNIIVYYFLQTISLKYQVVEIRRPVVESASNIATDNYIWMDTDYLQICERGRLKGAEEEFWTQLIHTYLKPIESTPQQQSAIAEGLISLRNSIAFAIIFVNALLVLAIYLIQKHKNVLSIHWTPYHGFKWTKMNEITGQFEETKDPLKIDPLGMGIVVLLFGILIVQSAGMLIHRLNTMIGTFQEIDQLHDFVPVLKLKKTDDERILTAARQMIDTTSYAQSHAADGYTRHRGLDVDNDVVLYKLQRARLTKCMQRAEAKKSM